MGHVPSISGSLRPYSVPPPSPPCRIRCGTTPFPLPVWQNSCTGRIPPLSLSVGEAAPGIFCSLSYPLSVCYVIVLLRMPYRILYQIHRRFRSQVDADKNGSAGNGLPLSCVVVKFFKAKIYQIFESADCLCTYIYIRQRHHRKSYT